MISANCYAEPQPLPPIEGLPPAVTEMCARCLAKKPADRPTSREIAAVLAATPRVRLPLGENGPEVDEEPTREPTRAHAARGGCPTRHSRVLRLGPAALPA